MNEQNETNETIWKIVHKHNYPRRLSIVSKEEL